MTQSLNQFLKYAELLHQYRTIERRVMVKDSERRENDTEHSYNLAMLAWYIVSNYNLDLNLEKVFGYALAHDLVEVYAGDTYFYEEDNSVKVSKHDREKDAALRIKNEFPEFEQLHEMIEAYEDRMDPESKFIYALDKIEPVISIYIDKGRTWKKEKISLEMIKTMKLSKVAIDKTIESIFKDLIDKIAIDEDKLFT